MTSSLDFILDHGIRKQMNALRKGFNAVFPIERLGSFAPAEVSFKLYAIFRFDNKNIIKEKF